MTALALLLAALAVPGDAPPARPSPGVLLAAFRAVCLSEGIDLRGAAAAAGFTPVPPSASDRETAAWEKDRIRLFQLAARPNSVWPLPAMCGARADIDRAENDDALAAPLLALPGYRFMEITGVPGQAHWNLILSGVGLVQIFIDRTQPTNLTMTFLAESKLPRREGAGG